MSNTSLYDIECVAFTLLVAAYGLLFAYRRLRRIRPDFDVLVPFAVGAAIRLVVVFILSVSGLGLAIRGGDEITFLTDARIIAASDVGGELWFPGQFHRLHEIIFAAQMKFGDFPEGALRVTQVGLALLGLLLLTAAIYDVAGARAARVAAWVFALEPASIMYNGILHREPLLVLASGLVVFGGVKIWAKLELRGVFIYALGCIIAVSTRQYAGWFLITAGLLLILHAATRQVGKKLRSLPLIYGVMIAIAAAAPAVLSLTSEEKLQSTLQVSQNANTDPYAARGEAASNNLSLERVDFSTRSGLVMNLPIRARDILVRPYPWQVANTSQQLGALGTLVALATMFLLVRYARRNRGQLVALTAPFLYPAFFLMVAYALSVGNAGTGFRYRTHLVLLGLATLVVLREHALRRQEAARAEEEADAQRASRVAPAGRPLSGVA